MICLNYHINKPWQKILAFNSFYCPTCLRTVIPSAGNENIRSVSLHSDSLRKPVIPYINCLKRSNLFQNKYGKSVNYNIHNSFHSLIQTYVDTFRFLSQTTPVIKTQNFLIYIHDSTGLPWWATILVSTVLFRSTIIFPLTLYQHYILAKIENLRQEFSGIAKELQNEVEIGAQLYKWSPPLATTFYRRSLKKHWTLMVERENCHPAKAFMVVLFQFPMWILYSLSIRNLVSRRPFYDEVADKVVGEMQHEGFLWITNLTVHDGTMIIPCMLCIVTLSVIEVNRLMHVSEPTRFQKIITNLGRCFAFVIIPIGYIVPSCLSFYWLTSGTVGLCHNLIVMSPKLRSLVGIPRTPSTRSNPYRHLWCQIQDRLKLPGSSKIQ